MLKGVMHGTVAAARAFQSQAVAAHDGHGGHVINVSSLGAVAPVSGVSLYQAAKAGCRTFSLAAAKDLASHNVVVSVLMPDAVATPMACANRKAALQPRASHMRMVMNLEFPGHSHCSLALIR
eukprot:1554997-Prymnesium_polylepis.2